MASPTLWTWVWARSRSCWWTGMPGMLQSIGLQRVGSDWANELNWTHSSVGKESTYNGGEPGSIPGLLRPCGEGIRLPTTVFLGFPSGSLVKNLPAMQETWVQSLGWEGLLQKERLPTPVFWPGEFHGLCRPWGHRVGHKWATFTQIYIHGLKSKSLICADCDLEWEVNLFNYKCIYDYAIFILLIVSMKCILEFFKLSVDIPHGPASQ